MEPHTRSFQKLLLGLLYEYPELQEWSLGLWPHTSSFNGRSRVCAHATRLASHETHTGAYRSRHNAGSGATKGSRRH
jgi:hypothetical protein